MKKDRKCLEDFAFQTSDSQGRGSQEEKEMNILGLIDNPFWIDEQKILNSKSFRRLAGKTQVFSLSSNILVRNRLTHTIEVQSIAEIISEILGLNTSLVKAIALAHDVDHAPFGHLGEKFLSFLTEKRFRHETFGPFLLEEIEKRGQGLNLSFETLEGIRHHSNKGKRITINNSIPLEYTVVMLADKFAYIFSDINDCLRTKRLKKSDLPREFFLLGKNRKERLNSCIKALCLESAEKRKISFSESKTAKNFRKLRKWTFENIYLIIDQEEERKENIKHLKRAYIFLQKNLHFCYDPIKILAIMTDQEILLISSIAENSIISDIKKIKLCGFWESIEYCKK
jgi:dGTPase